MNYQILDVTTGTAPVPAKLYTYFLDNSPEIDSKRTRPAIVLCPGGGYRFTSDREAEAVSSIVKQYYLARGAAPKRIFLPCAIEDSTPFTELLQQQFGKAVRISVPQRGENAKLVTLANLNAKEECERVTTKEERAKGVLSLLGQMLGLPAAPLRIESYDISHTAGQDMVASMVVFADGKPLKRDYRRFQIKTLDHADDLRALQEVLQRRMQRYLDGDEHFSPLPDLLLMDGGHLQAQATQQQLESMGIHIPILGMVKDDRHRTRALVTPDAAISLG